MAKNSLNIKVIGIGGIGLSLLPTLCRFLNYNVENFPSVEISLIDGDVFEDRNRERQEFLKIGPKATVTADEYQQKFSRITFWNHPVYLHSKNIIKLIRENDIVFSCVDNHSTRKLISDRAEELKNVTVISGGNEWLTGDVSLFLRREDKNLTPPLASKYNPEILNPTDKNPGEANHKSQGCDELVVASPQLLFTNNFVSSLMLACFYNIINKQSNLLKNPEDFSITYFDLSALKSIPRCRKV